MGQTMGMMEATTRRERRGGTLRRIPVVLGGLGAAAALALGVGVFGPASSAMALHHASEWQVATAALQHTTAHHHTKAPSRKSVARSATLDQVYDGFGPYGGLGGSYSPSPGDYCPIGAGPEMPIVIRPNLPGDWVPSDGWDWYYPGDGFDICF